MVYDILWTIPRSGSKSCEMNLKSSSSAMDFILCKTEKSGCQKFGCIWFENELNEI